MGRRAALADAELIRLLGPSPELGALASDELLRRAEHHGLAGVVSDTLLANGVEVEREVRVRELARELDHAAHMATLRDLDRGLAEEGIEAVVLKGALLGERFYPRPAARVTTDTDLLVRWDDLAKARGVLGELGYQSVHSDTEESRYLREHHHLAFGHPRRLPLELHFHAYRGFGRTLPSEPLIERSERFRELRALRVLAPADELVYLATHAAAHKFGRWSWLFDLRLLVERLDDATLVAAGRRARDLGYEHPVALAARLLSSMMGVDATRLAPLGALGPVRAAVAERLLSTPTKPIRRALSRLVYTTSLCSDSSTAIRWVARETVRRGREQLRGVPLLRAWV